MQSPNQVPCATNQLSQQNKVIKVPQNHIANQPVNLAPRIVKVRKIVPL